MVNMVGRGKNRTNSKVRAKVEHPIGVIKWVFGFAKVCYRGSTISAGDLQKPGGLGGFVIR